MLLFGILDIWTFAIFPLQKNIFIDKKEDLPFNAVPSNKATITTMNRHSMLQTSKQSIFGHDGVPEVMQMNASIASLHIKDN